MKYSKEFKDSTVQLILNNNESVVKVASDLDLNPQTLYNWVSAYRKEHNMQVIDTKTNQTSETLHEENKRLRHELKIAKQE
jgi:transposase